MAPPPRRSRRSRLPASAAVDKTGSEQLGHGPHDIQVGLVEGVRLGRVHRQHPEVLLAAEHRDADEGPVGRPRPGLGPPRQLLGPDVLDQQVVVEADQQQRLLAAPVARVVGEHRGGRVPAPEPGRGPHLAPLQLPEDRPGPLAVAQAGRPPPHPPAEPAPRALPPTCRSWPRSASRSLPEVWCTRPTTSAIGVTTSPTTSRSLASVSMARVSADRVSSSWRSSRPDFTHHGTATATAPATTSAHPPPDAGAPSRSTATPYP